jgi:hypothetical protein
VRGYVATTDFDWFTFLRARRPDEVNFWQPSGRGFHVLAPGEPLFFKLKAPHNAIGGFGLFARHELATAKLAWEAFGEKNGAATFDEMCARIERYQAYRGACAVTGEHSLPVLEAAHIRPYGSEGLHDVQNGLLLRADVHRLFDRGYVTITPERRFEVSRRLREEWENGKIYYALQGKEIALPASRGDHPDPALLRWHNENIFENAAAA